MMKRRKKRRIKIKIIIILLVLIVASTIGLFVWFSNSEKVELLKNTFQFEYGTVVKLEEKDVLDTNKESVISSIKIDYSDLEIEKDKKYPKVGSYDLQIDYKLNGKEKSENIKIIVKDTIKPKFIKSPETLKFNKGFNTDDLNSYFTAEDLSPFEIKIDTKKLNTNKSGEYEITVTATDKYNNKNEKNVKIIVKEEKENSNDDVSNESNSNEGKNEPNQSGNKNDGNQNVDNKATPYTVSGPRYVNGIMIVNKKNPVPYNYAPYENAEAGNQVRNLISEMQTLGFNISNSYSGFRSFETQAGLYQNYVNGYGKAEADTFSARAGYSEHQTGLAFDLLHGDGTLVVNNNEVNWIAQNAHRFGFIVRYKAGKEHITGYQAEPWHLRYVGNIATDIYNSGLTLEEYLGVSGGGY